MKSIKWVIASILILVSVTSCGRSSEEAASAMRVEAASALSKGDYVRALALLDSIDSICPDAVAERRKGMHLRALAKEGIALRGLEMSDSLLVATQLASDSLKRLLQWNSNSIEGYYTVKGASVGSTGIEGRVSPEGVFYIVATIAGSGRHEGLSISGSQGRVTTPRVGRDGERNVLASGHETIHFVGAECDTLGQFVAENRGGALTLSFEGSPTINRSLSEGERRSLETAWLYSQTLRNLQVAALEHQKYEQLLGIARSQIARTYQEN